MRFKYPSISRVFCHRRYMKNEKHRLELKRDGIINNCNECLEKQRKIDALKGENKSLKQKLKYHETSDGFLGFPTSLAKLSVKANTPEKEKKMKGTIHRLHRLCRWLKR